MRDSGFTVQPVRGTVPRSGYAVAAAPEHGWSIRGDRFSAHHLRHFVRVHAVHFAHEPRLHAGGWYDRRTGRVHLDLTIVEHDHDRALALARHHGELGVYDLRGGRTVRARA